MKVFPYSHFDLWIAVCMAGLLAVPALADDGSLSPQELAILRSSFHMDDHGRAMYNAITSLDISQLTPQPRHGAEAQRPVQQQDQDQHGHQPACLGALLVVRRAERAAARPRAEAQAGEIRAFAELPGILGQDGEGQLFSRRQHRTGRSRYVGPRHASRSSRGPAWTAGGGTTFPP